MGVFDDYEGMQMKPGGGNYYKVGDTVEIDDGIYIDYDAVVIVGGVFIAQIPNGHGRDEKIKNFQRSLGLGLEFANDDEESWFRLE